MENSLLITLVILAVAVTAFLSDKIPPDLVALLVAVALGLTGVLTPEEAFSGFSRSAVIILIAIFIMAEALKRTGVTGRVGSFLVKVGGDGEGRLTVVVMAVGAFLTLFMNNIATAAVLMPAISGASRRAGISNSRLLMPLAFATIIGGAATLFTTSNILLNSILMDSGLPGFAITDFVWVGIPVVLAAIVYMALYGRSLLKGESMLDRTHAPNRGDDHDLVAAYGLDRNLFRTRVPENSVLIDRPLETSSLRENFGVSVVAIERDGRRIAQMTPGTTIRRGDILIFEGDEEKFRARDVEPLMEHLPAESWKERHLESMQVEVVEAMIAPRSRLIGESLRSVNFREKYGLNVLAIWRREKEITVNLGEETLQFGDAMLLQGTHEKLRIAAKDPDLIMLMPGESPENTPVTAPTKGRVAVLLFVLTLVLAIAFPALIGPVMLGGALAMMLLGVLTTEQAYASIGWRSVFIIAGMLPMGIALVKTNAAGIVGEYAAMVFGSYGQVAMAAGLVVITMVFVQLLNTAVVAAIMGPIAINIATASGFDARALVMSVAVATSFAFVTPLGHPVNILVMGPAGYSFRDFFRVGFPLAMLLFLVAMAFLILFWL